MSAARGQARILFGGSFDPPQLAHTSMLHLVLERFPGAEIIVIPAGFPPHKRRRLTPFEQRLEMARLAFGELPEVAISTEESLDAPSYTVRTLERHRNELGPGAALYWLLGSDSLRDLPRWKSPERILELARILTVRRPGHEPATEIEGLDPEQSALLREGVLPGLAPPISSSEVRRRILSGEDVTELVDPKVLAFILAHGLYLPDVLP